MTERRYRESEFERIMEASAGAPPGASGRALATRAGLTLAEIQAIATEVGVSPATVARYARLLPVQEESETARLLGGPARIQLEFTVAGNADEATLGRVLEAIRRVTAQQGTAARAPAALEWTSGAPAALAVNVAAADGGTRVQILCDRATGGTVMTVIAVLASGFTFGIVGSILEPTGVLEIGGLALGIAGTAAATARTLWAASTRRCRALLARLTGAVADTLESGR